MQNRNPYAAPQTNVTRGDSTRRVRRDQALLRGRPHRPRALHRLLRSVSRCSIAILVGMAGRAARPLSADPSAAFVVGALGYIAIIVVQFLLTIQRSHDMNMTGWLCLISLIPLAALVFWFVPGTRGENNYGKPPPPNTTGAIVLACIVAGHHDRRHPGRDRDPGLSGLHD